jgi:hypothetical protein
MEKKGYKYVKTLTRDSMHKGKPLAFYQSAAGMPRRHSGVTSLTGANFKGSSILDGMNAVYDTPANAFISKQRVDSINNEIALEARRMLNGEVKPNREYSYLLPVLDQKNGKGVDLRYVMSLENKDEYLKRDDRIFETIGSMYSHIYDKKVTPELNELVLDQLEKDWDTFNQEKHPVTGEKKYDWRIISADSDSFEDREIYRLLPKSMQHSAKQRFKGGIPVRSNVANYIFGMRDISVTGAVQSLNYLLPKDASLPYGVIQGADLADQVWREVVQIMRVRGSILQPAVTVGNAVSNVMLLLATGVPPIYIKNHIGTAITGMRKYQRARSELIKTEAQITANVTGDTRKLEARAAFLRDSMNKNPVHELVEQGLFPAIVEDINVSALTARDNRILGRLSQGIEEKARDYGLGGAYTLSQNLLMMPGSKTFQYATAANQYGDFVARFIQYKYNTEKRGMDKETARHRVLDDFVNYDEPTDPRIKALNDYGLFMYSKFFLRIQKVYARLLTEKPAAAASMALLDAAVVDLDSVWIGDYFLNLQKAWKRLDLFPADGFLDKALGLPGLTWLNPFEYNPL